MVSGDPHQVALYSGWDDVVMTGTGVVLVATVSGSQALDAATGTPRWTFPGSTMYPPAVLLGDGTALLATEQGVISRVNLDDGGAVWQASLGTRMQNAGLAVAGTAPGPCPRPAGWSGCGWPTGSWRARSGSPGRSATPLPPWSAAP